MATPADGILLALTGLLLALQAMRASAGPCDGDALEALALEIARRRQSSQASKA
jgi:hypothetical protein